MEWNRNEHVSGSGLAPSDQQAQRTAQRIREPRSPAMLEREQPLAQFPLLVISERKNAWKGRPLSPTAAATHPIGKSGWKSRRTAITTRTCEAQRKAVLFAGYVVLRPSAAQATLGWIDRIEERSQPLTIPNFGQSKHASKTLRVGGGFGSSLAFRAKARPA